MRSRNFSPGSSCGTGTKASSSTRNRNASWCRPATRISSRRCACASGAICTASCTRWWPSMSWKENEIPAAYDAIHRALLAGLLGNIGCKSEDSGHYLGARGIKFLIHPGSALQQEGRQVDRRRRDHRDDEALRALRRAHRTGVAGESGRSPDQAQLVRSALGEEGDAGGGVRALDALRHRRQSEEARQFRPDEPDGGARDFHPPGPGRRRNRRGVRAALGVLHAQPAADARHRDARAQVSGGRMCWSTTS